MSINYLPYILEYFILFSQYFTVKNIFLVYFILFSQYFTVKNIILAMEKEGMNLVCYAQFAMEKCGSFSNSNLLITTLIVNTKHTSIYKYVNYLQVIKDTCGKLGDRI